MNQADQSSGNVFGHNLNNAHIHYVTVTCFGCPRKYEEQAALANDPSRRNYCKTCRTEVKRRSSARLGIRGTGGGYRGSESRPLG